jgi:hypothetical protein
MNKCLAEAKDMHMPVVLLMLVQALQQDPASLPGATSGMGTVQA